MYQIKERVMKKLLCFVGLLTAMSTSMTNAYVEDFVIEEYQPEYEVLCSEEIESAEELESKGEKRPTPIVTSDMPIGIAFIDSPTRDEQVEAVKRDPFIIKYIKNPHEKAQMAAVCRSGIVIDYIKNPSAKVQLIAVKQTKDAFLFIENPTKEVLEFMNL
jgi:hypothetical protein